jgi:hypothetical protein
MGSGYLVSRLLVLGILRVSSSQINLPTINISNTDILYKSLSNGFLLECYKTESLALSSVSILYNLRCLNRTKFSLKMFSEFILS